VLFDQPPEPIDLGLDLANRVLYWTDRGDPPRGNTVNRAAIDKKAVPEILVTHLMEGIGIALDVPGNRMFVTDFAGSVYSADLDGKNERNFLSSQGNLTGVAYAEMQERVRDPRQEFQRRAFVMFTSPYRRKKISDRLVWRPTIKPTAWICPSPNEEYADLVGCVASR
jgi:hypothetical protein